MAQPDYTVVSDSETSHDNAVLLSASLFPEVAIGIDLGTSQCSVAVWNGSQVELLRNTRNQKLMRSYVMFKDEIPTGGFSEELAHEEEEIFSGSAVFNMKRLVGRVDNDPVVHASKTLPFLVQTLDIGVRPFIAALVNNVWRSTTPEEVLGIFLVELKTMAEAHLKRPIRNAVLTVPVSLSRFQQTRIERACAMAGLHVLRLMPEPTAVALLYAQQQLQIASNETTASGSEKVALVFNMGAGYCDAAITATAGGVSQIKASWGCVVGGEDLLQNVMSHLLPNFDTLCSNHDMRNVKLLGLLRTATEDAIHKLSFQNHVDIDVNLEGTKIHKSLDRAEFEAWNMKVFEDCGNLVKQCLVDARVTPEDIDDVILVGGCSMIPKVRSTVLALCRKESFYQGTNPLEAAVSGAALEGAIASGISHPSGALDLLTIQATPLSLGIQADNGKFVPIIHRNTAIPAKKDLTFATAHDNQTETLILVYEGEGKSVEENHLLGYFKVSGIPPAPRGTAGIKVCMDIDASNILRVMAGAVDAFTQRAISPIIEVRMPTVDDGHGWSTQALNKMYGMTLDLSTVQKMQL